MMLIEPDAAANGQTNSKCWKVNNTVEVLIKRKANSASASRGGEIQIVSKVLHYKTY